MSRGTGRMSLAIALIAGVGAAFSHMVSNGMKKAEASMLGYRMQYEMRNHYRGINGGTRTGVASHKRASRRLRNIRARASKR